jgi:C-terminal peptidase prc
MATGQLKSVVCYLRKVTACQLASSSTDAVLLERFVSQRDEAAFEALLRRHGPMVLGLCRRVLRNRHDAEDAFQATFLVLVHKAGSVRKFASLSSWLYGVAYRTALQVRTELARRRVHEKKGATMTLYEPVPEMLDQEMRSLLDEEISRLPEKYRIPVVLCYLEGMTYEEASRHLRWPKGTVAIRLARARERLRANLVRRGVVLSGVGLAAAVPVSLLSSTVQAAALTAAGCTTLAGILPARVLALSKAVLGAMSMTTCKTTLIIVLVLGAAAVGPGLFLQQRLIANLPGAGPQQDRQAAAPARVSGPEKSAQPASSQVEDRTTQPRYDAGPLARRLWAVMELVEKDHLEPCPRLEMILAGATALLKSAKADSPPDLDSRAATITNVEQLSAFLSQIWPATEKDQDAKRENVVMEGLLKRIPGEPQLLTAASAKVAQQISSNRYIGIGIQLTMNKEEKVPQITIPFRGGVAHKAGVLPGDLLIEVDGKSTREIALMKVVDWVRGEEGTDVTIAVRQPGTTEKRTLRLTRAVIPFDTLLGYRRGSEETWSYRVDPALLIGYVRVDSIKASTLHELRKLENQLQAEGYRALVLDFRSSCGEGVLYHAALVADGLLDGGVLWSVRGAHGEVKEFKADRECLFRNWPLAVLVDKDLCERAQGAIIAALQDSGRAVVVGEPTRCDGYVNAILPLPESSDSIILRTARMERAAKGKGWPVQPDYQVPLNDAQRAEVLAWLRQKQQPESPAGAEKRPPDDPQLKKAMQLLRVKLQATDGQAGKP